MTEETNRNLQPYSSGDIPGGSGCFYAVVRKIPVVTAVLVATNILVFIICTFTGDLLYNVGAVGISLVDSPSQYYRLITSLFLHADNAHILNNMLLLAFGGEIVEKAMGSKAYAVMYFLSGICGTLLTFLHDFLVGNGVIMIGASGAVFGVMGSLLALVIFKRVRGATLHAPRIVMVLLFSVFSGFRQTNIAVFAHIGGLIAGFLFGILFSITGRRGERL